MTTLENGYVLDGMNELERNTKRIFDFFIALFCLIIFSPLFLVCYLAVKREDGGPAIFKQERIGRFGRPFYIYKFRSMRVDAEKKGPTLFNGEDNDPRLTKIGRFLRRHHLDELPQLWNVLKGDMSFVGPRPERAFYIRQIEKKDPRYYMLYQITVFNGYPLIDAWFHLVALVAFTLMPWFVVGKIKNALLTYVYIP